MDDVVKNFLAKLDALEEKLPPVSYYFKNTPNVYLTNDHDRGFIDWVREASWKMSNPTDREVMVIIMKACNAIWRQL